MIKYPTFIGRKGSKCYFELDKKFIKNHKEKACEMIAFYTLALFGHGEDIHTVLISTKSDIKSINFNDCLELLFEGNLKNKIFHQPSNHDLKLFNPYKGKFISEHMYKNTNKNLLKLPNDHKFYASQYDTYTVGTYLGEHVLEDKEDGDEFIVSKRTSEYEESCEPHDDARCDFCKSHDQGNINENNFTIPDDLKNKLHVSRRDKIKLNNLIFEFQ